MDLYELFKKITQRFLFKKELEKADISRLIREIRVNLIKADIPPKYSSEICKEIEEKLSELKEYKKFSLREKAIKAIYDVFVKYLGESSKLELSKGNIILLVGLLGSGKTTTAAKLANLFKKNFSKILLVSLDFRRKAAQEQLKQLAEKVGVDFLDLSGKSNLDEAIKEILEKKEEYDLVIVDTAGRNALDEVMLKELKEIYEKLKPTYCILVASADTGFQLLDHAKKIADAVKLNGIVVTKMDSSAKAGGALLASKILKVPIFYIGTGEKINDIEEFDVKSFVSRILGLGDITSLLKKFEDYAKELEIKEFKEINIYVVYNSIKFLKKLGPLRKVLQMIPGLSLMDIPKDALLASEEKIKKFEAIIMSLNKKEWKNPLLIKRRIREIAKGAGVKEKDVIEFLEFIKMLKKFEKMLKEYERMGITDPNVFLYKFAKRFRR